MSARRLVTVSPFTGWLLNAVPVAIQSRSVPVSKSKLSARPSDPSGLIPIVLAARVTFAATPRLKRVRRARQNDGGGFIGNFRRRPREMYSKLVAFVMIPLLVDGRSEKRFASRSKRREYEFDTE